MGGMTFFPPLLPTCDIFICDVFAACFFIAPKSNLKIVFSRFAIGRCVSWDTHVSFGVTQSRV